MMREMYNPELKHAFLREYAKKHSKATLQAATDAFRSCAKYEERVGVDLCRMSGSALEELVVSQVGVLSKSKWMRLSVLREYVRWCLASGIPDANDSIMKIDPDIGKSKIRTRMVSGPLQLRHWLDTVLTPVEKETTDILTHCFCWLAFMGIDSGQDAANIKSEQVDLNNRVVYYRDRELDIYIEALPAFNKAVNLEYMLYFNGNYSKFTEGVLRKRLDSDKLMRGIRAVSGYETLRRTVASASLNAIRSGKSNLRLSYDNIYMSGIFYRMLQREAAGLPIDFSGVAMDQMSGKEYKDFDTIFRVKKADLKNDYYRWKLTFY